MEEEELGDLSYEEEFAKNTLGWSAWRLKQMRRDAMEEFKKKVSCCPNIKNLGVARRTYTVGELSSGSLFTYEGKLYQKINRNTMGEAGLTGSNCLIAHVANGSVTTLAHNTAVVPWVTEIHCIREL